MSDKTPEEIIHGFLDYVGGLGKGLAHENGVDWVSEEQTSGMIKKYTGRLRMHHYGTGSQRWIEGRGRVTHCYTCDEPEGQGNHFHNPKPTR